MTVEDGTATPVLTEPISLTVVLIISTSVAGGVLLVLVIVLIIPCIIAIVKVTTKRKRGYDYSHTNTHTVAPSGIWFFIVVQTNYNPQYIFFIMYYVYFCRSSFGSR